MKNYMRHLRNRTGKLHYSATFERIPMEKQDRILNTAIREFAEEGYAAANINHIARKAGISVGSLYSYFASKEELFLVLCELGNRLLEEVMEQMVNNLDAGQSSFEMIEKLLEVTLQYSQDNPDFCKIYLDLSTEKLNKLSSRLTKELEYNYIKFYHILLQNGITRKEIREDLDIQLASFFLDNIVIMLQFATSSSYYSERLKAYFSMNRSLEQGEHRSDWNDLQSLPSRISDYLKKSWGAKT